MIYNMRKNKEIRNKEQNNVQTNNKANERNRIWCHLRNLEVFDCDIDNLIPALIIIIITIIC